MMEGQLRKIGLIAGGAILAMFGSFFGANEADAATQVHTVVPVADSYNDNIAGWSGAGTPRWSRMLDGNTSTYIEENGGLLVLVPSTWQFRMAPAQNIGQGVVGIQGRVVCGVDYALDPSSANDGLRMRIVRNPTSINSGSQLALGEILCAVKGAFSSWPYQERSISVNGSWSNSELANVNFEIRRVVKGISQTQRIVKMDIAYTHLMFSTLSQSGYQFYKPVNTPNPNSADIIAPTAASTPKAHNYNAGNDDNSRKFRLRMAVRTTDERWLRQYGQYRLQYGFKPANGQCSDVPSWYTVNNDTGSIQYSPIAGLADGTTIGPAAQDPNPGGAAAHQMHVNSSLLVAGGWQDPFVKRTEVPLNGHAIWDFALVYTGNASDQTFCFRIVNADGNTQPIDVYADYPEIRLLDGSTSVDIVDTGGASVSEPSVLFDSLTGILNCTPNSAMLGTSGQRIRVRDNRAADAQNWSLSIAPTAAAWTGSDNPGNTYPYNNAANAGCAGQLALHTGGAGVAASSGCNAANVQMPGGAFTGATPLTLASLPNSNDVGMGCYWDITGIELEQQVPGGTLPDTYSLPMTITMMAQ